MRDLRGARRTAGRSALAVVCGVVALVLTACAGIPTSGPVHTGGGISSERDDPFTRLIPQPPTPGMTPQEVVQGFLSASASFDDDHAVAREFLTADAARNWNAAAGVTVYDTSASSDISFTGPTGGRITVTAKQAGTISQQGEYSEAAAGAIMKADFRITQVAGEWRISALAPGLVLDTSSVQQVYRTYDVFFPDPSWTVLVPAQILIPVGPGLSTSLVRAALADPPQWLAPAVRSAVPAGTKLTVDSVPVRDGVAQVDLTSQASAAVGQQARAMSAQLVWTLRQVGGISSMRLTVDGAPLQVPSVGDVQSRDAWPSFDPDAGSGNSDVFYERKGRLEVLKDNRPTAVAGQAGDGSVALSRPAVSLDQTRVAGLDEGGHRLLSGRLAKDEKLGVLLQGATSLSPPSFDRFGAVWTVDRTATGNAVWMIRLGSAPVRVDVRGAPAGVVVTLRIARDGVRAAEVVRDSTGRARVYLVRVERTEGQLALSGFRLVNTGFAETVDVAWSSADRLLLLSRATAASVFQPWLVDLGGATIQSLGPLAGGAGPRMLSVTAAPSTPVMASAEDGQLWWNTGGFEWQKLGEGSYPAYPG